MKFDSHLFRQAFPAITDEMIYLDSAATALKPVAMVKAITDYYLQDTASAYRSAHKKAHQVTGQIEQAREKTAALLHAGSASQLIWTKGATESANLIAYTYAKNRLKSGDEIIVTELEHHSNLLPWLSIAKNTGAKIIKWPVDQRQRLNLATFEQLLNEKTQLVAVTQMSNVTGYQPDLGAIIAKAHAIGAAVVVDGAQGVVHSPINVNQLNVDFYFFSAHKLYGPTGLGVLYVRKDQLKHMPIWQSGGKMAKHISFCGFVPDLSPNKYEAGTPNIASILGFSATLDWLSNWDEKAARVYCCHLADEAENGLLAIKGVKSYRAPGSPMIAFAIQGVHHSDVAILLSEQQIAVRSGELCASPFMQKLGVTGLIRASFAPYNTHHEIARFTNAVKNAITLLTE